MKLITHDGTFHADEVFATAILNVLFPGIKVHRTRNLSDVKEEDIVYDVGLVYNGTNKFDHHQNDDTLVRENGLPYSSFGLIWKHYGCEFIEKTIGYSQHNTNTSMIWEKMDESLVQSIDADDNGFPVFIKDEYPRFTVSNIISNLNNTDTATKEQYECFLSAVELAKSIILKQLEFVKARVEDYFKVKQLITDSDILVLPQYLHWGEAVKDTNIKYVIFPTHKEWRVRPVKPEFYFKPDEIEDHPDFVFCHKSGFLAGTKTVELARELVEKYGK